MRPPPRPATTSSNKIMPGRLRYFIERFSPHLSSHTACALSPTTRDSGRAFAACFQGYPFVLTLWHADSRSPETGLRMDTKMAQPQSRAAPIFDLNVCLPVDLRRKELGDQVVVVGLQFLHIRLGGALRVEVVGVELLHPGEHRLVVVGEQMFVSPLLMPRVKRVIAEHVQGLLRQVVFRNMPHVSVVPPRHVDIA